MNISVTSSNEYFSIDKIISLIRTDEERFSMKYGLDEFKKDGYLLPITDYSFYPLLFEAFNAIKDKRTAQHILLLSHYLSLWTMVQDELYDDGTCTNSSIILIMPCLLMECEEIIYRLSKTLKTDVQTRFYVYYREMLSSHIRESALCSSDDKNIDEKIIFHYCSGKYALTKLLYEITCMATGKERSTEKLNIGLHVLDLIHFCRQCVDDFEDIDEDASKGGFNIFDCTNTDIIALNKQAFLEINELCKQINEYAMLTYVCKLNNKYLITEKNHEHNA